MVIDNVFFLHRPLPDGIGFVSQNFGENPAVYKIFGLAGHDGLDYGAVVPDPIPILSMHDGFVFEVGSDPNGFGNFVRVKGVVWTTIYGHMADNSVTVRKGDTVKAGDRLGSMGNTGFSTGRHLHAGGRLEGVVNPGFADYLDVMGFRLLTDKLMGVKS